MDNNEDKITATARRIPKGRVATYGQVAKLAGIPKNARQVGTVLRNLPENSRVPWYRVVNSQGRISERSDATFEGLQQHLLAEEGVFLDDTGRIDLANVQWRPNS